MRSCCGTSARRHGWWCWRGDRDVLSHCAQWRPSVPLLRHHMSAAAFAYQPQQAAARVGLPGCSAFGKAKASGRVDVYTQGWQGSDCGNNAQSPAPAFVGLVVVGPFRDVDPGSWLGGCGCLLRIEAYVARLQTRPLHVGAVPFETPVDPSDHVPSALLGQCPCAFRCIARAIAW